MSGIVAVLPQVEGVECFRERQDTMQALVCKIALLEFEMLEGTKGNAMDALCNVVENIDARDLEVLQRGKEEYGPTSRVKVPVWRLDTIHVECHWRW